MSANNIAIPKITIYIVTTTLRRYAFLSKQFSSDHTEQRRTKSASTEELGREKRISPKLFTAIS